MHMHSQVLITQTLWVTIRVCCKWHASTCVALGAGGKKIYELVFWGSLKRSAHAVQLFGRLAVLETHRGRLKRSARAVQLFGRLAVLETHTLRY